MKNLITLIIKLLQHVLKVVKPKSIIWFAISIILIILEFWTEIMEIITRIIQIF